MGGSFVSLSTLNVSLPDASPVIPGYKHTLHEFHVLGTSLPSQYPHKSQFVYRTDGDWAETAFPLKHTTRDNSIPTTTFFTTV